MPCWQRVGNRAGDGGVGMALADSARSCGSGRGERGRAVERDAMVKQLGLELSTGVRLSRAPCPDPLAHTNAT